VPATVIDDGWSRHEMIGVRVVEIRWGIDGGARTRTNVARRSSARARERRR